MKKNFIILISIIMTFSVNATELVKIKGGEFTRNVKVWNEYKSQTIKLDDFQIAETKVTVKEYKIFLDSKKKEMPKRIKDDFNSKVPENIPIYGETFFEALEYCNWLSEKESLQPCYKIEGNQVVWNYNANGYRLPTEAEWEYAASCGWKDMDMLSDDTEVVGKYLSFVSKQAYREEDFLPHEVMQNKRNKFGLYDVLDNCSEWCWDLFNVDYYDITEVLNNPKGPDEGYDEIFYKIVTDNRVKKGTWYQEEGDFKNPIKKVYSIWPTQNSSYISIRLARNAE